MHITKENIHDFIDGTKMYCCNLDITKIEFLPSYLISIECDNNKLTSLPKLPDSLKYLYCGDNQLTSLPKLPENLIELSCNFNNLPYEITIDNYKEKHNKLLKRKEILKRICK
tara:strand:+ start:855 stop:1193 length:339 start_codon:yes stop_codon:yes gene_type:complete